MDFLGELIRELRNEDVAEFYSQFKEDHLHITFTLNDISVLSAARIHSMICDRAEVKMKSSYLLRKDKDTYLWQHFGNDHTTIIMKTLV